MFHILPEEEAKRDGSFNRTTEGVATTSPRAANVHGESNGSCEPEYGGDDVEDQGGEFMEDAGHINWGDADICQHQK